MCFSSRELNVINQNVLSSFFLSFVSFLVKELRYFFCFSLLFFYFSLCQQVSPKSSTSNSELEDEVSKHSPHSQAPPHHLHDLHPSPHSHLSTLDGAPSAQHSTNLTTRQEVPLSPQSPLPTMGSPLRKHPLTPPPNITVRDIANSAVDSIAIVGTASCHMMDEKPLHVKRRKGDPDGIALGEWTRCFIRKIKKRIKRFHKKH